MQKTLLLLTSLFLFKSVSSQKVSVTWGEEFKLKKGTSDLEVIYTDNSGVYMKESHYLGMYSSNKESASLIKLGRNLEPVYSNDFNKEVRGKYYEGLFFIKGKMYLLASDASEGGKKVSFFAALINRETGELAGEWMEVNTWIKDDKKDQVTFKADYTADSTKMIIVSTVEDREKNQYEVKVFDDNMRPAGKSITINTEFTPDLFKLESVLYTSVNTVVLAGREYQYQEGKKKKAKYKEFKRYKIQVYDNNGALLQDLNTGVNNKWLISSKLAQISSGDIILAAFYSNQEKYSGTNGMLVQRINAKTGAVISTSDKALGTGMITEQNTGKTGDEEEGDGFSKFMQFRNFIATNDGGLVIIAEKFLSFQGFDSYYSTNSSGGSTLKTTSYTEYQCGEIVMSKIETATGNISWLYVVPKSQQERYYADNYGASGRSPVKYFGGGSNWPFYSGFGVMQDKETVNIIFNDHPDNANVLAPGAKLATLSGAGFYESGCYAIQLNTLTGKYSRKLLFSNTDQPIAMPRLGSNINNELYLVGKLERRLGKTKIVVGRIVFK